MMHRCAGAALALLTALSVGYAAAPEQTALASFDWPQWQGPDRNAICRETGLLHEWPPGGPPLLWTASGLGVGYSTPSIAAGRIFTMGNVGDNECLLALDEQSQGKQLWSTVVGPVRPGGGDYPGPRCTPTVDGDRAYALGLQGDLVCCEAASGNLLWRKSLREDFGGRMMSIWGFSESPLVDADKVICTPGNDHAALVALDKATGRLIWESAIPNAGGAAYSSAVISDAGGVRQYVQLLGKGVVGVDASTGKLLWRYDRVVNRVANIPTPIVRGNLVFVSTSYDAGSALLRLVRTADGVNAEEVYFLSPRVLQNHHGGLVLVGDYLYGGHGKNRGEPICVQFETGKVMWHERTPPGERSAAVLYADGDIYFRYENGVMALVRAKPTAYELVGKFRLPQNSGQPSWPHPVISHGRLYIRDQDNLLCFDVKQH